MTDIIIDIGGEFFPARFEKAAAPKTVARFRELLPYQDRIIHVRWSGEACWIPMGDRELGIGYENATSYPAPGQVIVHPGGRLETPSNSVSLPATCRNTRYSANASSRHLAGTSPLANRVLISEPNTNACGVCA